MSQPINHARTVLTPSKKPSSLTFDRVWLYAILLMFAFLFLMPIYVMVINSIKPLDEIRAGNLVALPLAPTLEPWVQAWSQAQIGVQATGLKPYFLNSFLMVIPAVLISTALGALNGYVLTQFKIKGGTLIFGLVLFSVFIPFQIVLIPMAKLLGELGLAGTVKGLILVHTVYGIGFGTLFFRNFYAAFPQELVKSARMDGAGFFVLFWRLMLPASLPIVVVNIIWQFTNIWNDFLFGASFSDYSSYPLTVALNNLVSSSTGVKEYNVHFAGAFIAALPTLIVYIVSGKYFVRGLMAGSVKG
jgi:glucose/mannose transport system permease protein